MPKLKHVFFVAAMSIATTVVALDPDSEPSYSNPDRDRFRRTPDKTDLLFEKGKAIYKRKESARGAFKYCIVSRDTGEEVKLKGKYLEPYDGATYDDLAKNIRNCKDPDESLADSFDKYDAIAVMYYLKKRYKITLKNP